MPKSAGKANKETEGRRLTIRQERFAEEYVLTGNASEAYRTAYPASKKWKDESVNTAASLLLKNAKVSQRVEELKAEAAERATMKRDDLVDMLVRVITGEQIEDYREMRGDTIITRTINRTWAIDRLCKLLGYDAPERVETTVRNEAMTEAEARAFLKELESKL